MLCALCPQGLPSPLCPPVRGTPGISCLPFIFRELDRPNRTDKTNPSIAQYIRRHEISGFPLFVLIVRRAEEDPLSSLSVNIASVELGRWSVRNPRTFITENTENTECRGSPCRTPGNQDFHSDFLSRCSSCLARPPYSPFSPYSPFLFANRSFRPPNDSDVIQISGQKMMCRSIPIDFHLT